MEELNKEAKLQATAWKEEDDLRVREAVKRAVREAAEIVEENLPADTDKTTRMAVQMLLTYQLSEQYRRVAGPTYTATPFPIMPLPAFPPGMKL